MPLDHVKHIVVVLSGKGGVGKSTVACQLALTLAHSMNLRVGILDVDICGPSVPKICGVENGSVLQGADGTWTPVEVHKGKAAHGNGKEEAGCEGKLFVMSIAYLLPSPTDAVVWRGPRKDAMIKQFIQDVRWGELDYLIVDTPPGTSDEHMTLCEAIARHNPTGAVIVTTPQEVSTDDVKKELSFCHKLKLRCLGIVENMSGFICPHCSECTDIFSKGGGKKLADLYDVQFLGEIPLDAQISVTEDAGVSVDDGAGTFLRHRWQSVVQNILAQVARVDALVVGGEKSHPVE